MEGNTCKKCSEKVSETAMKCPHCGYEPEKDARRIRLAKMIGGVLLTLTGVGALLGLPILIGTYYKSRTEPERRPTTHPA